MLRTSPMSCCTLSDPKPSSLGSIHNTRTWIPREHFLESKRGWLPRRVLELLYGPVGRPRQSTLYDVRKAFRKRHSSKPMRLLSVQSMLRAEIAAQY